MTKKIPINLIKNLENVIRLKEAIDAGKGDINIGSKLVAYKYIENVIADITSDGNNYDISVS